MFEASIEPSEPPAPINVCISSRNKIIFPASMTSAITFLIRSSNSPRYFEPATIADRSSVSRRFERIVFGTSPETIRCASPSTIAVLPTPGSPTRHGLFFVRREIVLIIRLISSVRPITGSSRPSSASFVRSRLYLAISDGFISASELYAS